jgi:hypothetical protein
MKSRFIFALLAGCTMALGEDAAAVKTKIVAPADADGKTKAVVVAPKKTATPALESAIPDSVKALPEPAIFDFPNGLQMAVTTASEKAQIHVNQGMNHLHGGWEFEASRHFAAAMREDPDCLLAHWGMVMSLLTPSPETDSARVAVTTRLLDLLDAGTGTELERGYVFGLTKYLEEGPAGAAIAFRKVAAQFPNDLQAGIFAALFGRGGYDEMGSATPDQESSDKILLDLIEKFPLSPLPLNALLTVRAEAPDLSNSLELARKLCQVAPAYPPYFHLLGHYEWRCGEHGKATSAFGRAVSFFETWMKENKATVADCPEWVKAECYRIVAIVSKGESDTAYAAARKLAATPLPKNRGTSPGSRLLLWDAKTLPARVLLHRGLQGNADAALHSLPEPAEVKETRTSCLAFWWIDGLRLSLEARRLLDAGNFKEAQDVVAALTHQGETMTGSQTDAATRGERSSWGRAFRAMEVLASDLRARLALAGPPERAATAYNWFASAADRQRLAPMMSPPMILTPMASRLAGYQLSTGLPLEAIESYHRALTAFPNDMDSLIGLKAAYEKAQLPADVANTAKRIADLKAQ